MGIKEFADYLASKKLSASTMRSYLSYYRLFDSGLEQEDLTQGYVNRFMLNHTSNVSRSFLKNLFDLLDITHIKVTRITGRKTRKKNKTMTKEDRIILRKWLYYNKNIRYLYCFDLSYWCALRRGEIFKILIKDFNIKIWATDPSKPCKLLIHGKGDKERYVIVPPKLMNNLIDYMEKEGKGMDDRLFPFNYTKWHKAFKEAVRTTLEYNFKLHDLRRSRATLWLEDGVDLIKVRDRLGHTSVKTTQLYINSDEKKGLEEWANEY